MEYPNRCSNYLEALSFFFALFDLDEVVISEYPFTLPFFFKIVRVTFRYLIFLPVLIVIVLIG